MRHTRIATTCLWCMVVIALTEYRPVRQLNLSAAFDRFCQQTFDASDLGKVLRAADHAAGGQ